jgi:hypothetical protein
MLWQTIAAAKLQQVQNAQDHVLVIGSLCPDDGDEGAASGF